MPELPAPPPSTADADCRGGRLAWRHAQMCLFWVPMNMLFSGDWYFIFETSLAWNKTTGEINGNHMQKLTGGLHWVWGAPARRAAAMCHGLQFLADSDGP